jgi:uncharacterized protein (DUF2236 family)
MVGAVRKRLTESVLSLFAHGPQPLERTLDHLGDPGLLGPGSVSWEVIADSAVMLGGIRALLVQTAHPEVVAGVEDHSNYRADPLGRLTRTSLYVTETTYGSRPEVEAAVRMVRRAHRPVHGRSGRDIAYDANDGALAAWVHNVLTDSFLAAFQAYGPRRLSATEADRFVDEQSRIGELLGADPLPRRADELRAWIVDHPALERSEAQAAAVKFLRKPPLGRPQRVGYELLLQGALATIPPSLRDLLGLRPAPGADATGALMVKTLRWALGPSPVWKLALERSGAEVPEGLFRRTLQTGSDPICNAQDRQSSPERGVTDGV